MARARSGKQLSRALDWAIKLCLCNEAISKWLSMSTFNPFVLTTVDGFALAVTDPRKALLGVSMIVIANVDGRLYQIPFRSIAHLSETGVELAKAVGISATLLLAS